MLTLAAMHAFNDSNDPFFTSLPAGEYDQRRPQGQPCDAAIQAGCGSSGLSNGAKIAIAVVVTVVGLLIIGLTTWYLCLLRRRKRKLSSSYTPVYRR
jgi:endoglucanase